MQPFSSKIGVTNSNERPHVVWVEPRGEDFTLLPGEELEIHVYGTETQPWFNIVERDGSTQVYLETATERFEVCQGGNVLECGHNRQAAIDAGFSV